MKKLCLLSAAALLQFAAANAQSKVFKEVGNEISSQIKAIRQDNALAGYLAFTQLEKASADSFNYRITIMDENLNDIGKVNFRDENLNLHAVAFDNDVLCLAFLKSDVIGKSYKNKKDYKAITASPHNFVSTRFLSLDGKTIATASVPVDISVETDYDDKRGNAVGGHLQHHIQLTNVPQKGFTVFYGDEADNYLLAYDDAGKQVWKKAVGKLAKGYYMLGTNEGAYLLSKRDGDKIEGGYEINGYGFAGNVNFEKLALKDKQGASLKVLGFDNDPKTGKPYITGTVINPERNGIVTFKDATKQPYIGVFTWQLNGLQKSDVVKNFSYWNNDKTGMVDEKGKFLQTGMYGYFNHGFVDQQGNTYFAGSEIRRRPQWGTIGVALLLSPLVITSPMIIAMAGTSKCKTMDAMLLKQTPDGKLSYHSTVPCNHGSYKAAKSLFSVFGPQKEFYQVSNADTKTDYLIVNDTKDIVIYNVTAGKVARTIPRKDGKISTGVFPAKEGHVMVTEYNKKEKYTRVSIESL